MCLPTEPTRSAQDTCPLASAFAKQACQGRAPPLQEGVGPPGLVTPRMASVGVRRQGLACSPAGHRLRPTPAARMVSTSERRAESVWTRATQRSTRGPAGGTQSTVNTAGSSAFWVVRVFTHSWFSLKSQAVAGKGSFMNPVEGRTWALGRVHRAGGRLDWPSMDPSRATQEMDSGAGRADRNPAGQRLGAKGTEQLNTNPVHVGPGHSAFRMLGS